ncbi:PTS sugar transporter subunit IIB [Anaerosacchariphilus polymeriproducens]|uniref:PTS sugar transporter subunit IIB n=1 Tax=Anaerosacchariphilus polymeriproducens TaxID=1812858 RepID=A0A371AYY3_9FIRM|nr:PTS sugar transporter subunit IIB [Anaerosacchariphilus polymeriproducens]RDU24690.1 PTS sugar transporter subunit IIB [Anaerosacchariphilus polymeriproducens]
MEDLKVILCCGAGMSSGFLANALKKASKKRKMNISASAHAESNVMSVVKEGVDVLCIGPHYASRFDTYKELCSGYDTDVILIPKDIYGTLDGEGLLDYIMQQRNK